MASEPAEEMPTPWLALISLGVRRLVLAGSFTGLPSDFSPNKYGCWAYFLSDQTLRAFLAVPPESDEYAANTTSPWYRATVPRVASAAAGKLVLQPFRARV